MCVPITMKWSPKSDPKNKGHDLSAMFVSNGFHLI